jgi:ATP-dependent DNA helicase RecG
MNSEELHELLQSSEDEFLEFKDAPSPEVIARAISAFLNSKGGRLILGVRDRGHVTGISNVEQTKARIEKEVPRLITPAAPWTVEAFEIGGKNVIIVEVPTGADQPYVTNGAVYLRRGEKIETATRDEMTSIIMKRVEVSQRWERQMVLGADTDDLNLELIRETIRLAKKAERWSGKDDDVEGFLASLGLSESGGITNAALLFYGKKLSRFIPQAGVRLLVSPAGKSGGRYVLDKWFDANLIELATDIPKALAPYTGGVESTFSEESWQREDRLRYPSLALREGILNALVHRDYALTGSVLISIQAKTLEITNPGKLPDHLKPADLKKDHLSTPRNPDLAHLSFLHGLIEKVGRGTQKILAECRQARLRDPKWVSSGASTSLTIYAPSSLDLSIELTERQQKILSTLASGERIKGSILARRVDPNVSSRTIRTDLLALIRSGLLIPRGRGRSTSYQLAAKSVSPQ